ncbi:hypothetical protein L7F22_011881 [Adiantum nelumboides]|nr:hypothetical protein [Adiantum nelumboides]
MKDNELSARDTSPSIMQTIQMMQRERKRKMIDGAAKKPIEDANGKTKTSKDQLEKETEENSNMEFGRKDVATSNIDNLDDIISMTTKSTMKDPPNVDTSFRVDGQVQCASNIEDQEDKNTEFVVLSVVEDMEIIIKKYEPPEENGDASMDAGYANVASRSLSPMAMGDVAVLVTDMARMEMGILLFVEVSGNANLGKIG